jgi:hypothetical protein
MSAWTSSLRLRSGILGTGACVAAFACAANGWAAGGTPIPAPDDPPPAYRASTVKAPGSTATRSAPTTKRASEAAQPVPMPDAPVSTSSTTTAHAPAVKPNALPGPDPSSATGSTSYTRSATVTPQATAASRARATTPATRSTFVPARAAPPEQRAKAKPTPAAKPQQKPDVASAKQTPPPSVRPRDDVRLGLPVGGLAPSPSGGDGMRGGLLVAAALLLAAAAGGSLVLGLAARGATRHA